MNKKIIQIIPCQTNTKIMYEAKDEDGNDIYALTQDGHIMRDGAGEPIYEAIPADVHCLALVEEPDGNRYVEPIVSMGEYLDLAENYIAVYRED